MITIVLSLLIAAFLVLAFVLVAEDRRTYTRVESELDERIAPQRLFTTGEVIKDGAGFSWKLEGEVVGKMCDPV